MAGTSLQSAVLRPGMRSRSASPRHSQQHAVTHSSCEGLCCPHVSLRDLSWRGTAATQLHAASPQITPFSSAQRAWSHIYPSGAQQACPFPCARRGGSHTSHARCTAHCFYQARRKWRSLGLPELTSNSELIRESNLIPWQCRSASHSMHGCMPSPAFGSSPAMVLPLSRLETERSSLEGNHTVFSLISPITANCFNTHSRPLANERRAACLLRACGMKSFTTKIIPVQ